MLVSDVDCVVVVSDVLLPVVVVSDVTWVVVVVVGPVSDATRKAVSLLSKNFPPSAIGRSETRILTV